LARWQLPAVVPKLVLRSIFPKQPTLYGKTGVTRLAWLDQRRPERPLSAKPGRSQAMHLAHVAERLSSTTAGPPSVFQGQNCRESRLRNVGISMRICDMLIGYARVSTDDQDLRLQRAVLKNAGCRRILAEKVSGAKREQPELARMVDQLRDDDVVVCHTARSARAIDQRPARHRRKAERGRSRAALAG